MYGPRSVTTSLSHWNIPRGWDMQQATACFPPGNSLCGLWLDGSKYFSTTKIRIRLITLQQEIFVKIAIPSPSLPDLYWRDQGTHVWWNLPDFFQFLILWSLANVFSFRRTTVFWGWAAGRFRLFGRKKWSSQCSQSSGLVMIFIYSSLAWCDIESEWWILYLIFKILQVTPSRQLQLDGV